MFLFLRGGGGVAPLRNGVTNANKSRFFGIRKPQVISGGGGSAHPLHPPPRSAPALWSKKDDDIFFSTIMQVNIFQLLESITEEPQ